MIFLRSSLIWEFSSKNWEKDTFWHWEYNPITATKLAKNKPCNDIVNSKTVLCFKTKHDRFMGFNKYITHEIY